MSPLKKKNHAPEMEFHISRAAREEFRFDDTFFSIRGDVVFENINAAQAFAEKINARSARRIKASAKGIKSRKLDPVQASHIHAMGLLHEIFHFIIASYKRSRNPNVIAQCDDYLASKLRPAHYDHFLEGFVDEFPPRTVYRSEKSIKQYLKEETAGIPHRSQSVEELLLVWLQNQNPSFQSVAELIDDSRLARKLDYKKSIYYAVAFFAHQPKYGPFEESLIEMLRAPTVAAPDSIMDQLEFVKKNWEPLLSGSALWMKLLGAMDFIREEGKYLLMRAQAEADRARRTSVLQSKAWGTGDRDSAIVPSYTGALYENEPERFSADLDWMPRLVLIAKNIFVWLDQLSKQYRRRIARLDEIPDEELDTLARRGFTGLWLIGVWQRSRASERIKRISGNSEALASAYSLDNYDISEELGGERAYRNLRDRAAHRGIRLASDMVPNHMGIDSSWVINHPEWFVQSDYPPFPAYSFTGPDLSDNDRVGIFIEDGYWKKSDASVVFKRLDRWTGDVKYIFHGNDGTHMPWNDTAQLNFLKPEVREAVIQTILHVARLFPIIRFDAAMVLSKKHYQRLWFPEPGTGGAIPSRSNWALTRESFDAMMPVEFWREVVDRIQREAPNTLLLAEAFWLMEGFFVRTLGMHRVYNSAFMNMLKKEENANYRSVIKNVLEYNPQILKRFVNFMNNPDEETAVAQFGKEDKYFGACVLMATLPGLPMFGHGQIEGFGEKYGMEYRRAYYEEHSDEHLVARHEREIVPLLKKRYLFAEAGNFYLYDFFTQDGFVNEDVYAYSNRFNGERALVVYNNKFAHTVGWISRSVGFVGPDGAVTQQSLFGGLDISDRPDTHAVFRDVISGMEFIRENDRLKREGLFVDLGAFKYQVFLDFREVRSTEHEPYAELCRRLNGKGVPSVGDALWMLKLEPLHAAVRESLDSHGIRRITDRPVEGRGETDRSAQFDTLVLRISTVASRIDPAGYSTIESSQTDWPGGLSIFRDLLLDPKTREPWVEHCERQLGLLPKDKFPGWKALFTWALVARLRNAWSNPADSLIARWRLQETIARSFRDDGSSEQEAWRIVHVFEAVENFPLRPGRDFISSCVELLHQERSKSFVNVHSWNNAVWFNKELFEELAGWAFVVWAFHEISIKPDAQNTQATLADQFRSVRLLVDTATKHNYDWDKFLTALSIRESTERKGRAD